MRWARAGRCGWYVGLGLAGVVGVFLCNCDANVVFLFCFSFVCLLLLCFGVLVCCWVVGL